MAVLAFAHYLPIDDAATFADQSLSLGELVEAADELVEAAGEVVLPEGDPLLKARESAEDACQAEHGVGELGVAAILELPHLLQVRRKLGLLREQEVDHPLDFFRSHRASQAGCDDDGIVERGRQGAPGA